MVTPGKRKIVDEERKMKAAIHQCRVCCLVPDSQLLTSCCSFLILQKTALQIAEAVGALSPQFPFQEDRCRDFSFIPWHSIAQPLVYAVKLSRELNQTKAFSPFRGDELYPGSQVKSDTEIIAYIRNYAQTIYHPVGTCKMGHDEMAVVDNQLRVRGVEGLRVVDASIMPTIVSGNTNAPVIMIAEKSADLIAHHEQGGWKCSP